MKINCDYCGAQIDTDKYDTCPNCGGGFDRDRELLKEKEKLNRVDELYLEKKKLENERLRIENENLRKSGEQKKGSNAMKALGIGCAVPLAMLGILFVIIMIIVIYEDETGSAKKTSATEPPSPRITGSITISIDPVSMPEIPEIPEIPAINVEPDIPDITTLPEIDLNTRAAE